MAARLDMQEEVLLPLHQTKLLRDEMTTIVIAIGETDRIDDINSFSAFVFLALDPVTIQVREQSVDVVGTSSISVPFAGIIP